MVMPLLLPVIVLYASGNNLIVDHDHGGGLFARGMSR